jgi:hypothetical protein
MASRDELARLQAERVRLLSMLAYEGQKTRPDWSVLLGYVMVFAIGVMIVGSFIDGETTSFRGLALSIVIAGLAAYVLSRKFSMFGTRISLLGALAGTPLGPPSGEAEARQRLADCEAQIVRLRDS